MAIAAVEAEAIVLAFVVGPLVVTALADFANTVGDGQGDAFSKNNVG